MKLAFVRLPRIITLTQEPYGAPECRVEGLPDPVDLSRIEQVLQKRYGLAVEVKSADGGFRPKLTDNVTRPESHFSNLPPSLWCPRSFQLNDRAIYATREKAARAGWAAAFVDKWLSGVIAADDLELPSLEHKGLPPNFGFTSDISR